MAFRNSAQRGAYFEMLKSKGMLGNGMNKPMLGLPPAQHNNAIASSPALPGIMPPKSNQPNMMPTGLAPNPMKPLNPMGGNKFGRIRKFF